MKKIFVLILVFIVSGALLYRCEEIETGFDKLSSPADPAATEYYVQFINALKTYETGVTVSGDLIEIEKPISVTLMGMPQDEPITVNLTRDPSSTLATNMYTLSANSITIAAGKTSGSVTFKTVAANMPVGQTLKLVLTISAGEHNSPNVNAIKLTYNVKRIEFCPLASGVTSLAGTYAGDDAGYPVTGLVASVNTGKLEVAGIGEEFIADFWAETVVAGGTCLMTIAGNGIITIPRQYIFTTVYSGTNYDYEIIVSGKWENCGTNPKLIFTYDIYYEGEADGLAKQYAGYLGGIPYLSAELTRTGTKSGEFVFTPTKKFTPIDPSLKPKR